MVQTFNDVFDKQTLKLVLDTVNSDNWYFGHGSFDPGDPRRGYPFWRMDLKQYEFFSTYLLNIIQEKTQQEYELYDVYANGHTFGTAGDLHVDWYDDRGRTFLFYAIDDWKLQWGGKTVFELGDGEYHYQLPKPNTAVLFPGKMRHAAEPVTRSFAGLRITIAWKLLVK